jgi:DNA-binding response OmpR family regulator
LPGVPQLLIIDDDRKIVQAVRVRLLAAGYDVQSAHDGEAGLAAAMQAVPDTIVLDLRMPKLDGLGVLARLRDNDQLKHIPVIVLSASAVDECKALDAGAFCFLPKPYDPPTLLQAVSAALNLGVRPPAGSA